MMSDKRILELADRLVASGPKCCAVSASECHEIRDYIHDSEAELQAKLLEQRENDLKIRRALRFLVEVKDHKDANGKDDWYEDAQPMAWEQARTALNATIEER